MKKTVIITICLISIMVSKSQAQVTDTIAYMQQIVADKNNYIGKPFSVLEKGLKIKIKYFSPFADITYDNTKETSTFIGFVNPKISSDFLYPKLFISWQSPYLNHKEATILYSSTTEGGGWTSAVDSFYAPGIIKDIKIWGDMTDSNDNVY